MTAESSQSAVIVPETSLYSNRLPDAHECVMRLLGEHYLTREALVSALAAYELEDIERSIYCGLMGGAIRSLSDGRLYRRRS